MKKAKYEMCIDSYYLEGIPFRISKKEFNRQLKHYKELAKKNNEPLVKKVNEENEDRKRHPNKYSRNSKCHLLDVKDCEDYIDEKKKVTEYEKYIETTYIYRDNTAANVFLTEYKAKDGYYWK